MVHLIWVVWDIKKVWSPEFIARSQNVKPRFSNETGFVICGTYKSTKNFKQEHADLGKILLQPLVSLPIFVSETPIRVIIDAIHFPDVPVNLSGKNLYPRRGVCPPNVDIRVDAKAKLKSFQRPVSDDGAL
jgi:hypothetical protein